MMNDTLHQYKCCSCGKLWWAFEDEEIHCTCGDGNIFKKCDGLNISGSHFNGQTIVNDDLDSLPNGDQQAEQDKFYNDLQEIRKGNK